MRVLQNPWMRIEKKWRSWRQLISFPATNEAFKCPKGLKPGGKQGRKGENSKDNALLISPPPLMWPDSEGI